MGGPSLCLLPLGVTGVLPCHPGLVLWPRRCPLPSFALFSGAWSGYLGGQLGQSVLASVGVTGPAGPLSSGTRLLWLSS